MTTMTTAKSEATADNLNLYGGWEEWEQYDAI